ncbi:hypothetical protein AGABI1DRAFT_104077 [Agaricus bisporus var. burnettii JB137-S8]|uniref:Condensation domain-containing protein n=2 Tax=Agaricus bisporus var. burnettii TaxID=192524 RepID=K5WB51_AGABU|nr:uncharacterized protein AGABI1DRAFT_104077 [Agaricus bisporus var. burnettii JB137-S8]EKM84094.1 hypothetical protein AGABI1DRAFT_104077 [Agaricus bisporus var. burnettii JB137-S8]KAF7784111.1 hypothetical protein Agabi119p4_276 [Agaricus bisporus var. burnettii]
MAIDTLVQDAIVVHRKSPTTSQRKLGETETSYYLPSRESGVNDMYLHLGFKASTGRLTPDRFLLVWAILRLRHPLLAARVELCAYDDIRFIYDHPKDIEETLRSAQQAMELCSQTKDELIDNYLNGQRTLSNDRLSFLILSSLQTFSLQNGTESENEQEFDLLICAAHYIGDGMALHTFANEFFVLLGGKLNESELRNLLELEVKQFAKDRKGFILPSTVEDQLPLLSQSKFFKAAAKIDFKLSQRKLVGGQSFPKVHHPLRHTVVPTVSFDPLRTNSILRTCKTNGVSISSALFAICNIAWARTHKKNPEAPVMMYTALNLRPYLKAEKALNDSYWFLAIGYFNIILPAFLPQSCDGVRATFWHRAKSAKKQSADAAKHPLIVHRTLEMARERGSRARVWARQDDDRAGVTVPSVSLPASVSLDNVPVPECLVGSSKAPSTALIGLSMLGNLDGIYKHIDYHGLELHTLTTGSRQRPGGMLLFGYTFVGKLWVSLGYDENGFDKEIVGTFWKNVLSAVDELLM